MQEFDWSRYQSAEVLEQARSHRFQPEWRPILLQYMGLTADMDVLEVGCGPGTLAPFLARALAPGTVTGLDLDARFIERVREKAGSHGLINLAYVVGDAYQLPFADASFDAVTSYTGIGVLTDPERAVAEMVRVCRPGGTVSILEAISGPNGLQGSLEQSTDRDALYPGVAEYLVLCSRLQRICQEHLPRPQGIGSRTWPVAAFPGLMAKLGLKAIRINAWGYCQAPNDARHAREERLKLRQAEYDQEIRFLESLRENAEGAVLATHGFSRADQNRLIALTKARHEWVSSHPLFDWTAGLSVAFAGRKPRSSTVGPNADRSLRPGSIPHSNLFPPASLPVEYLAGPVRPGSGRT